MKKCYVLKGHDLMNNATWICGVCTSMKKAIHYKNVLEKDNDDETIIYSIAINILL